MIQEPRPSEEVVFTTPPTRLFRVRLTPKVGILKFFLLAVLLSVMLSAVWIPSFSGLESVEILSVILLCVGLAAGGSALLYFGDISRQRLGLLRLDPDAIRWHGPDSQPVKLPYADLGSARRADERLVLQGKEAIIELPAAGFEDPGAIETILQDISTRLAELPGGGPQPLELPLTASGTDWHPFEGGSSLGKRGSEAGVILRDEEHEEGSRITLERGGPTAPFAITCGIYGWMVHTRFFGTEAEASIAYERMKADLADILSVIPYRDDPEVEAKSDQVVRRIHEFVERHP